MIEAESSDDDFLLTLVQSAKDALNLRFPRLLGAFLEQRISSVLLRRGKQLYFVSNNLTSPQTTLRCLKAVQAALQGPLSPSFPSGSGTFVWRTPLE